MTPDKQNPADQRELLPCPFCLQRNARMYPPTCDKLTPYNPADRAFPIVRCVCGAEKSGVDWDKYGQSAIDAWNLRSAPPESVAAVPDDPVAIVERKEVHGNMCVFINRTPSNRDIPDGTKLYAAPAREPLDEVKPVLLRLPIFSYGRPARIALERLYNEEITVSKCIELIQDAQDAEPKTPLTENALYELLRTHRSHNPFAIDTWPLAFARAVEAAHGIKAVE